MDEVQDIKNNCEANSIRTLKLNQFYEGGNTSRNSVVGIAIMLWSGGSKLDRGEFSGPLQADPGAHSAFRTMDTEYLSRRKSGRGVALAIYPI